MLHHFVSFVVPVTTLSAPSLSKQPEQQGQNDAHNDRRREREVELEMFPFYGDVARQPAETHLFQPGQQQPDDNQNDANGNQ